MTLLDQGLFIKRSCRNSPCTHFNSVEPSYKTVPGHFFRKIIFRLWLFGILDFHETVSSKRVTFLGTGSTLWYPIYITILLVPEVYRKQKYDILIFLTSEKLFFISPIILPMFEKYDSDIKIGTIFFLGNKIKLW